MTLMHNIDIMRDVLCVLENRMVNSMTAKACQLAASWRAAADAARPALRRRRRRAREPADGQRGGAAPPPLHLRLVARHGLPLVHAAAGFSASAAPRRRRQRRWAARGRRDGDAQHSARPGNSGDSWQRGHRRPERPPRRRARRAAHPRGHHPRPRLLAGRPAGVEVRADRAA